MPRFYDPNLNHDPDHHSNRQKRILKGHEGAGQFTAEDFHLARQQLPPRPAPVHPRLEPPPPLPPSQRMIPAIGPAESQLPPSLFASPGSQLLSREELDLLHAREELYERLSRGDTARKRAVATFRARGFRYGDSTAVEVNVLDAEQVKAVCNRFDDVQRLMDEADAEVRPTGFGFNEAQRGTAIHVQIAKEINGHSDPRLPPKEAHFRAETSVVKTLEAMEQEGGGPWSLNRNLEVPSRKIMREKLITDDYGKFGTIRFDALEFVNHNTVCVYDIKTANAVLNFKRMGHFAELLSRYGNKLIVVIQVKPSHMYMR